MHDRIAADHRTLTFADIRYLRNDGARALADSRARRVAWRTEEEAKAVKREVVKHRIASVKKRKASPETEGALTEAMTELATLAPAQRPMLLSDDATSEALIRRLQSGPLFMCSAEGRPFELMSGLYRNKGEDGADVYLKSWSEDPIRAARVTSGDVFIARPSLTLCLAVQPAVVDKLARRDEFRGRGLIARFLCSFPVTQVGYREWTTAQPLSDVATFKYNQLPPREHGRATAWSGGPAGGDRGVGGP
jgi:replicative DNA helicase